MFFRLLVLLVLVLMVDYLTHLGLKQIFRRFKGRKIYSAVLLTHWIVLFGFLIYFFGHLIYTGYPGLDYKKYRSFFWLMSIFMLFYLPKFGFSFWVIVQNIVYTGKKLFRKYKPQPIVQKHKHRNKFFLYFGLGEAVILFFLTLNGIVYQKSEFIVTKHIVEIKDLPVTFNGFKIVQFSDAHLGSFYNKEEVMKGIIAIQSQKPDLLVFTGDMVNNLYTETEPYVAWFKTTEAPFGKYSILGNHDVGDYVQWKETETKQDYINKLLFQISDMGFVNLLNENRIIKKGNDSIALIGVENWGKPPFKQYGDLGKAMKGIENVDVKILLSHDPSHWDEKVVGKTDIDLTLSGHTHGGQMGIRTDAFQWSLVQYVYKHWLGMYEENDQKLYVNAGFGYIGFIGRIGIKPEISVFILKRK